MSIRIEDTRIPIELSQIKIIGHYDLEDEDQIVNVSLRDIEWIESRYLRGYVAGHIDREDAYPGSLYDPWGLLGEKMYIVLRTSHHPLEVVTARWDCEEMIILDHEPKEYRIIPGPRKSTLSLHSLTKGEIEEVIVRADQLLESL